MIDLSGLPDPSDRDQAWVGDEPAYAVWSDRMRAADLDLDARKQVAAKWRLMHNFGEEAIDRASLEWIASLGPLRELGAGSGYNAKLLLDVGGDVIATDPEPWMPTWTPVEIDSYETAPRDGRIPLLVWPYMNVPNQWLQSDDAPSTLLVINDVEPRNVGRVPGYNNVLAKSWELIESREVRTGWRYYTDYVHLWKRDS
ncbi:hypothetical protein ACFVU2_19320 [Leifsonia sp. NPDC058194]|uniref:hypothetical protein n=1 Tax=Leifsonia sp. NPDC058194 TaxID=3346374 RepID=UPI0036DD4560